MTLDDQFGAASVRVVEPKLFCNPVAKKLVGVGVSPIEEPDVHQTCYEIEGPQKTNPTTFDMFNQLETDTFTVTAWELLCVPSAKLGFTPVP